MNYIKYFFLIFSTINFCFAKENDKFKGRFNNGRIVFDLGAKNISPNKIKKLAPTNPLSNTSIIYEKTKIKESCILVSYGYLIINVKKEIITIDSTNIKSENNNEIKKVKERIDVHINTQ